MDIHVSAKNFVLTPSVKIFAEEKVLRLQHFWQKIIRVHVELSINRHHQHGEIFIVHVWLEIPGQDIHATAIATDIHAAIDLVYPKIERQVLRAKNRREQR